MIARQKNCLYVMLLLGSGMLFGSVVGILLFSYVTGGLISPADMLAASGLEFGIEVEPDMESTPILLTFEDKTVPTLTTVSLDTALSEAPNSSRLAPVLFRINPSRSNASFSVYETFPEGTAIGQTREVAGDIIVDFNTPANSKIGIIRINLRSLSTGDLDRDRSIRCCVLLTAREEFEFAEFTPTSISQLPAQVVFGEEVTFQLIGDLALRGVSRPVVFEVEMTLQDAERLDGIATTVLYRRDYGILNNSENGFDKHGVANEVTLEFEFQALAVRE